MLHMAWQERSVPAKLLLHTFVHRVADYMEGGVESYRHPLRSVPEFAADASVVIRSRLRMSYDPVLVPVRHPGICLVGENPLHGTPPPVSRTAGGDG